MQTMGRPPRKSAVLREIEKFNRIHSVGFNNNKQYRPRSQSVRIEWMKTKKMVILYIKTTRKIFFEDERKRRSLAEKTPNIIIAENPFEHKFTIWAENIVVLKKLSDEFNEIDGVSQKGFSQRGFSWAVVKSERDGEFYLKSPYHSGGTTLFSRVILRKIRVILDDIQYEERQARKKTQVAC